MLELIDQLAPPYLSLSGDSVGLQVGDSQSLLEKILVTLEVTPETLREALRLGANLVVSHHPLIFEPLTSIDYHSPVGGLLKKLVANDINLIVSHTNLDTAPRGLNYFLGEQFGIINTKVLHPTYQDRLLKLVVFVPEGYQEEVRKAISEAGAGWIGNYSHCTFQTSGTGTFMPREKTNPFKGEKFRVEKVNEIRLETVLPYFKMEQVIHALQESHPYEEVAFDLYSLENEGIVAGLGVWGDLAQPITLKSMAQKCKEVLSVEGVKVWGDLQKEIHTMALCGGSGGKLIGNALEKQVALYLSGDLKHHEVQHAQQNGMAIIDAGHRGTEEPVVSYLADYIRKGLKDKGFYHEVIPVFTSPEGRERFV